MKPVASKGVYVCQECGAQLPKWQGRCPECGAWNTLVEERLPRAAAPGTASLLVVASRETPSAPMSLPEVPADAGARMETIGELDRVLGGGLVKGGVVLLGGAPGIGKSTLLLQASALLADRYGEVLYTSGEESLHQTKLRGDRLGLNARRLVLLYETQVEEILRIVSERIPVAAVVDSVQTIFTESMGSAPGSVGQVRECAGILIRAAKLAGIPLVLVGHITKDGSLAGPRVLEHMVDTVLSFEGESHGCHRLLRATKNRFGGTEEVGIFTMGGSGLVEVRNPSEFFLAERARATGGNGCEAGSAVIPILEGYRPFLVEVQALVTRSYTGIPRRTITGLDPGRVNILLAVLEKRCRFPLGQWDLFMNVAGAMKVREPAADLGVAAAVASSFIDHPLPPEMLLLGEVGLGGEVRAVSRLEARLREGRTLGFTSALVPASQTAGAAGAGMRVTGVRTLPDALKILGLAGGRDMEGVGDLG